MNNIINLSVPPFPYFVVAGSALFRPGDVHRRRSEIGVFDLIYVEYGELYITENGVPYTLRSGDCLILSPNGLHFSHKPIREETLFHWIHFIHEGSFNIADRIAIPSFVKFSFYKAQPVNIALSVFRHLSSDEQTLFLRYHKELSSLIIDNYQQTKIQYKDHCYSALCAEQLLLQLFDLIKMDSSLPNSNQLAKSIMDYLSQNYDHEITLESLSSQLNFHPSYLTRVFKKEYGVTIILALNKIRVSKAKQLLKVSDMSLNDIIDSIGFNSVAYFDRIFKKMTGTTPNEYRKHYHNYDDLPLS